MYKKTFRTLCFLASLLIGFAAQAQTPMLMPQPSPSASVMQQVGFNKITIDYSSPAVKGRTVYGDMLPWGTTWRAGANAPTMLSFSLPVTVGETNLNAGKYSVFITPMKNGEWMVHLNAKGNMVYDYMADGKIDEDALTADAAVSVKVKAQDAPFAERLAYYLSANDNNKATITMHWGDKSASFDVDVRTEWMMERMKGAF